MTSEFEHPEPNRKETQSNNKDQKCSGQKTPFPFSSEYGFTLHSLSTQWSKLLYLWWIHHL